MLYSSIQWWSVEMPPPMDAPTILDGDHLSVNVWEL